MEPLSTDESTNKPKPKNTVGEQITLAKAEAWTAAYQTEHQDGLRAVYFSADVFTDLLKQGVTGIRIYNAINSEGKNCFVLVGATEDSDLTSGKIFDRGACCPETCVTSPLNHS